MMTSKQKYLQEIIWIKLWYNWVCACCISIFFFLFHGCAAACQLLVPHQWHFLPSAELSFSSLVQRSVVCCSAADMSYSSQLPTPSSLLSSRCSGFGGRRKHHSSSPPRWFSPILTLHSPDSSLLVLFLLTPCPSLFFALIYTCLLICPSSSSLFFICPLSYPQPLHLPRYFILSF